MPNTRSRPKAQKGEPSNLVATPYSEIPAEPVDWLWEPWIPRGGLTFIVGAPGLGKSLLWIDLASRISTGRPLPYSNQALGEPAEVACFAMEDCPQHVIKPRLVAARADASLVLQLDSGRCEETGIHEPFRFSGDTSAITDFLDKNPNTAAIVVDPIMAYWGSSNANRDQKVRRILDPLARIAREYNIAVICVAHPNKSEELKAIFRISGSMAFANVARSIIWLSADDGDSERRIVEHTKSSWGVEAHSLAFKILQKIVSGSDDSQIETACLEWEPEPLTTTSSDTSSPGGPSHRASKGAVAIRFLQEELEGGDRSSNEIKELAKEKGIAPATLKKAADHLGIIPYKETGRRYGKWMMALPTRTEEHDALHGQVGVGDLDPLDQVEPVDGDEA